MYYDDKINLKTEEDNYFIDITPNIEKLVKKYKLKNGFVHLFNQHTTSGIWINENESGLLVDVKRTLDTLIHPDNYYQHDDMKIRTENIEPDERKNGHSHIQSSFFSTSETIPVIDGTLQLGKWQTIFYVDLDTPKERTLIVQLYDLN